MKKTGTAKELLRQLHTDEGEGLSQAEANRRLKRFGENRLEEAKKKTMTQRCTEQLQDKMIWILIGAAVISFGIACLKGDSSEFLEPILILLIVFLNGVMGVLQESKAQKALDSLKELSAPKACVLRDGKKQRIEARLLVPGDILFLESGDFIPADGRLLTSVSLKAEESLLTGESLPSMKNPFARVEPNAPLGEQKNMVFSGCTVAYGRGTAVVTATGMNTEMGRIAHLLQNADSGKTPLQEKLARLGKYLSLMAVAACILIFTMGILSGMPPLEMFIVAVSLAVSAIPEGLPAVVTVVLALGVQRMVKEHAIVRRLPAVETLGSASVICSDKTGTLTQNQMTVVKAYVEPSPDWPKGGAILPVEENATAPATRRLLLLAALCCSEDLFLKQEGDEKGDPTELAIIKAAKTAGYPPSRLKEVFRFAELPFDSYRKRMCCVVRLEGKVMVIVKGAFDSLEKCCSKGDLAKARRKNEEMAGEALRVLAVAYKELPSPPKAISRENLEQELTFFGLLGMIDPPRPEAKKAVALCRRAGIKPVMITGDHISTASAIAKQLDILRPGETAITGSSLNALTDKELERCIQDISVYARVSPEDKIRIVRAWQKKGQVVAMTGDGVNDAPALKAADIGCAMGKGGTDVAKAAADMTLTDDNFATIVKAVEEGRGIYENIRKVVEFLLGCNIGEVLTVFFAMVFWRKSPFISMQLLWINLVTDSLPAIALGMEKTDPDVMKQKPKPRGEGILAGGMGRRIVWQGFLFAALTLAGFIRGFQATGVIEGGRTMAFLVLSSSQIVQAFNMRSYHSLFLGSPFGNRALNRAALASFGLIALVAFSPVLTAFGLIYLTPSLYLEAVFLCLIPLVVMEADKRIRQGTG